MTEEALDRLAATALEAIRRWMEEQDDHDHDTRQSY